MKVELIKQTTKYTGGVYYYVSIDGSMQSHTFTTDLGEARRHLLTTVALVRQYPANIYETIETIDTDDTTEKGV